MVAQLHLARLWGAGRNRDIRTPPSWKVAFYQFFALSALKLVLRLSSLVVRLLSLVVGLLSLVVGPTGQHAGLLTMPLGSLTYGVRCR